MMQILQDKILILCNKDVKIAEILQLAVEDEEKNAATTYYLGWEWSEVRAQTQTLKKLVIEGIVKGTYSSRISTNYKLMDTDLTKQALTRFEQGQQSQVSTEVEIPEDIFSPIIGYDDIKFWIKKSLNSEKPVHILLIGPPASAKSMFLMEIARIHGAAYYSGTAVTKPGIQRFLADTKPQILILDETDKMDEKDQSALFQVMESGVVTELKVGRIRTEYVPVKIYAAGNSINPLGEALRSRFLTFYTKPYTSEQFKEVVTRVLVTREGKSQEMAEYIADKLTAMSRDPRDGVQFGRLCNTKQEVDYLLNTLQQHY